MVSRCPLRERPVGIRNDGLKLATGGAGRGSHDTDKCGDDDGRRNGSGSRAQRKQHQPPRRSGMTGRRSEENARSETSEIKQSGRRSVLTVFQTHGPVRHRRGCSIFSCLPLEHTTYVRPRWSWGRNVSTFIRINITVPPTLGSSSIDFQRPDRCGAAVLSFKTPSGDGPQGPLSNVTLPSTGALV